MAEKDSSKESEKELEKERLEDRSEADEEKAEPKKEELPEQEIEPDMPVRERPMHGPGGGEHYYSELTRMVSILFVGVLALMTFLLTVGLQRPHGTFRWALYSTVVILPLNLLAFVFGHLFADQAKQAKFTLEPGDKKLVAARKRLGVVRFIHQLLFMLAVLAVAWLAFSAAQFFFNLPANPAAGGGMQ